MMNSMIELFELGAFDPDSLTGRIALKLEYKRIESRAKAAKAIRLISAALVGANDSPERFKAILAQYGLCDFSKDFSNDPEAFTASWKDALRLVVGCFGNLY